MKRRLYAPHRREFSRNRAKKKANIMTFKNILVGISDDDASTTALNGAAQLASAIGAKLHIVHASENSVQDTVDAAEIRTHVARGLEGVQLAEAWRDEELLVRAGEATEVMLMEAKRVGADLLVVGPHRKRRFDFGSTAKALMKDSHLTTLIQVGKPRQHGSILVAVDLTPGSKETLRVARGLASSTGAKIIILHCYEGPAFAYESSAGDSVAAPNYVVASERRAERAEFEAFLKDIDWGNVEHESVFVEDDPAQHLIDIQNTVDLIVVGRHGPRGIFGSVGSLSNQLHKKIESPLLIVPHD